MAFGIDAWNQEKETDKLCDAKEQELDHLSWILLFEYFVVLQNLELEPLAARICA